jgi:hypothetical protein
LNRRGFLGALLAASAAPAFVKAESLMKLYVPPLVLWGDGIHDDTKALQAFFDGRAVKVMDTGQALTLDGRSFEMRDGRYLLSETIILPSGPGSSITGCYFAKQHFRGDTLFKVIPPPGYPSDGRLLILSARN